MKEAVTTEGQPSGAIKVGWHEGRLRRPLLRTMRIGYSVRMAEKQTPSRPFVAAGDDYIRERKPKPPTPAAARKNLYIKGEDIAIWERAEQLAGESLSQLISDQLRRYVGEREAQAEGFERIVVEAKGTYANRSGLVRKVAFYGRWLTNEWSSPQDSAKYRAALTKGGKIAVHRVPGHYGEPQLKLYTSLKKADEDGTPGVVLDQAAAALDTEFVYELDI